MLSYAIGCSLIALILGGGMVGGAIVWDVITWRREMSAAAGFLVLFAIAAGSLLDP